MLYEVEIRFWINNTADVWSKLPFLKQLEWKTEKWHTEMFGIKLFEAGELLRISEIYYETHSRLFLGWKGVDKGKLANIREELGEEITDGITKSLILQTLGLERKSFKTSDNVVTYLSELSMPSFMTFSGENLVAQDMIRKINYKIMQCPDIKFNLLVEVEKIAESLEEAFLFESELMQFASQNKLESHIIHEEPPTLLYLRKTNNDH